MNYICKCTIPRHAKASCDFLVKVPTYRTYASGYKDQTESKTKDSVEQYCSDGTNWCPCQEIIEQKSVAIDGDIGTDKNDVCPSPSIACGYRQLLRRGIICIRGNVDNCVLAHGDKISPHR